MFRVASASLGTLCGLLWALAASGCGYIGYERISVGGEADEAVLGTPTGNPNGESGTSQAGDNVSGSPAQTSPISNRRIATGYRFTCVLAPDDRLKCWGENDYGQLGLGDTQNRGDDPARMVADLPWVELGTLAPVSLSLGGDHACMRLDDGTLRCWGKNTASTGVLGVGDASWRGDDPGEMGDALSPPLIGNFGTVVQVAAVTDFCCALNDVGQVKCWGDNTAGQLGQGDVDSRGSDALSMGDNLAPVDLNGDLATQICVGRRFSCALTDANQVKCWGANGSGQLGLGDVNARGDEPGEMGAALPAVALAERGPIASVHCGRRFACVRFESGEAVCWGEGEFGNLGNGSPSDVGATSVAEVTNATPVQVGTGLSIDRLALGRRHACALLSDGNVKCWGRAFEAQLGLADGSAETRIGDELSDLGDALPALNMGDTVVDIVSGPSSDHTCALYDDGRLKCWGSNASGELGLGDTTPRGLDPGTAPADLPAIDLGT